MQPDSGNLSYFKLRLSDLTELTVAANWLQSCKNEKIIDCVKNSVLCGLGSKLLKLNSGNFSRFSERKYNT